MHGLVELQFGLAAALSTALLDSLWQNSLLAVAAAALFALLGSQRAALRHTVGMILLLAMLVVPALSFIDFWSMPRESIQQGWLPAITAPAPGPVAGQYVQQNGGLADVLSLGWMLGALLMLLRHFGGWRMVEALDLQPYERLPLEWQHRLQRLQRSMGIGRRVVVRMASDIVSPFTARWLRPVIWLPASMLTRLPGDQIEALLAHELAHISRHDWLWNGLQCVVESLLFFHPAAWWLGRCIRQEREHACDDLAVMACADSNPNAAISLAEALAELEYHRQSLPRLVLTAQGGSLMQRISRLLGSPRSPARRWLPIGAGLLLVASVAVMASTGHVLPRLHIESSTDGRLGPGDSRRIEASGLDGERIYKAHVDAQGKLVEEYTFNGARRPIDAQVRGWVDEMVRLGVPPLPPSPPAPPAPPSVQAPPAPPTPPAPPSIADSTTFRIIHALVAKRPEVEAAVGSPTHVMENSIDGEIGLDRLVGSDRAEFSYELTGPKGRAHVEVTALRGDGLWALSEFALKPKAK